MRLIEMSRRKFVIVATVFAILALLVWGSLTLAAAYDITEIDVLEHNTASGTFNSLVQIDSTHFLLAYSGQGTRGNLTTFSVDSSADTITVIDNLEHDGTRGQYNSLVKIDDTHFILAYAGSGDDGFVKTFSIDGSYDNITEIASLEHDLVQGRFTSMVKIDSTHFMLAYKDGTTGTNFVKTFSIDGSYGNITEIDSLQFESTTGGDHSLVQIDSTHFMVAHNNSSGRGQLSTFSIDGSYQITEIDQLEHDTGGGTLPSLAQIDSTHFILAYTGADGDGFIKTFLINGSYVISEIASLEHDATNAADSSIKQIDATHFLVAYSGVDGDGFIKTFSIDGSYSNITEIDVLEHDLIQSTFNSLIKLASGYYGLAYTGDGNDGYVKTFAVEEAAEADEQAAPNKVRINSGGTVRINSGGRLRID